jgi:glycopeptide antibiotics resistance protein
VLAFLVRVLSVFSVYSVVIFPAGTTEYTESTERSGTRRSHFQSEPQLKSNTQEMRPLSRTLFAAYLLILLWLVLFKFSYEPFAVVRDFQTRSLNLIPFAYSRNSEMIANVIAFIPFGVMLGVNFKQVALRYRLAVIFAFSVAVEIIQYCLAFGATDITDVIMNTLGGCTGLAIYGAIAKQTDDRFLDRSILIGGTLILLAILYLRVFVFIVRY